MASVNSLQLFVPEAANSALHIAQTPKKKDEEYFKQFDSLKHFWDALEEPLVRTGLVKEVGICDIESMTLQKLYEEASLKPSSVMVIIRRNIFLLFLQYFFPEI